MTVDPDRIHVVDGQIATSAGSSAAVDLCLHLIRREQGAEIAGRVARELVVPAHRSGGQAQFTRTPVAEPTAFGDLLEWVAGHLDADLSVAALAARAAMSARTFIRHFTAATGTTPAAWVRDQRVRRAEELLESDRATIAADRPALRLRQHRHPAAALPAGSRGDPGGLPRRLPHRISGTRLTVTMINRLVG